MDGSGAHIIVNFDLSHQGTRLNGNCFVSMDLADAEWLAARLSDSIAVYKKRAAATGA
jgi:hypothetical protein